MIEVACGIENDRPLPALIVANNRSESSANSFRATTPATASSEIFMISTFNPAKKKNEDFFYAYRKNGMSKSLVNVIKEHGSLTKD
jgi:hypothetical protein